jgi:hypothetical protein
VLSCGWEGNKTTLAARLSKELQLFKLSKKEVPVIKLQALHKCIYD